MAPHSGTGPKETESPKALKIIALLREYEIVNRVQKSFRQRQLPEETFYWFPSSVKAWVDLCRSTEYRNANRAVEVLNVAAPEIAGRMERVAAVCGLGCGEGSKDAVLLRAFQDRANHPDCYLGADFSQALLELAIEELKPYVSRVSGVKCDVADDQHLAAVCSMAMGGYDAAVIFTVLGNTLGAFGAAEFPQRLRRQLRMNDWLVCDGEIFSESTLAGYDNPTNRRFAWGPLNGVGITESDGRLDFAVAPAVNGMFQVTKQFTAARNLRLHLGGEALDIEAGEKLRMSSSIKYADESALLRVLEAANFRIEGRWKSSDGKFVLACARAV